MPFFFDPASLTKASFRRFAVSQKNRTTFGCAICFSFVIRLGFAKVRCFTTVSCVLLVLLVLVNMLLYNAINAFVVVWIGDKIPDFA